MDWKSLGFSLLAFIIAGVFALSGDVSGFQYTDLIISGIASIAGVLGVTNWRNQFDQYVEWFKSKTKGGAIITAVTMIAIAVITAFNVEVPAIVLTFLKFIVVGGGGWTFLGANDAVVKNSAK